MSFSEFVFSAGFIQKIIKVDQDVRIKRVYPQRKQPQMVPEDTKRHPNKADRWRQIGGAN